MKRTDLLTLEAHLDERTRVRRADRAVRWICLGVAGGLVALAGGGLRPRVQAQRVELQLIAENNDYGDMPPSIALPTALLSTFRGLMIHFLWARSEELKQENKYYELQQLSDWICDLQPRYAQVWKNAAWNLAYNVSVGTYSPRERWYWVSAGAYLLRDKGLFYNPKSIGLYQELAWIFQHKMGDFMDDHHYAYKRNWAVIMERVLGQPPPAEDDAQVSAAIKVIAEAAGAIQAFGQLRKPEALQLYIEHDSADPSLAAVVQRLAAVGLKPDATWLEWVARNDRRGLQLEDLRLETGGPTDDSAARQRLSDFRALMHDSRLAPARDRLLAAVRAHVLQADLKLDPPMMHELMEQVGPLDWRTVYSQSLYWAARGIRECSTTIGLDGSAEMSVYRYVQFGIKDTIDRGRLVFEPDFDDPFESYIYVFPDVRFIDVLHKLYLEQAEALRGSEDPEEYYQEGPAGRLFKSGHVNALHGWVRQLYLEGRVDHARRYYDYLRESYKEPNGETKAMYLKPLEAFVMMDFLEDAESFKQGPVIIDTLLRSCYINLAFERPRAAAAHLQMAQLAYQRYMQSKEVDRTERRKIPKWPKLMASALEDFVLRYPLPSRINLVYKARAWALADLPTKLDIYRRMEPKLAMLCAENDPVLDPLKAFPPPEGLEAYEANRDRETDEDADTPRDVTDVEIDEGRGR